VTLRSIFGLCITLLLAATVLAQGVATGADLQGSIRALGTTLRVLQITAHPGDEDGALLLYQVRGQGASVTLLTLTRGERDDNRHDILEPAEQGLLRTMEQLASDEHYGVDQRFTRVVDFGFARTSDEVFDRWGGHNAALSDIVRVIRETHPDIIITPFEIGSPDGDGQHQATAILVREAFRAAADPKKFPEQLTDGVEPWQAKRLFVLMHSGAYSVAFNSGAVGAGEHESWQQQAERALTEQRSQQGIAHLPHDSVRHYRLIESAAGSELAEGARDFADGLNSGIASLLSPTFSSMAASRSRASTASARVAGLGEQATLQVQSRLRAMSAAAVAAEASTGDRLNRIAQITEYLRNLRGVQDRMIGAHASAWLRAELAQKRKLAEHALLLAADVRLQARLMDDSQGPTYVLVPGASFAVQVQLESGAGVSVNIANMELKAEGGRWAPRREWNPGDAQAVFRGRVPPDAPFTRPQFLLDSEEDGTYRILDERNATRPLPPPSLQAIAEIEINGEVVQASAPVEARDGPQDALQRTAVVAPPISVIVEPRTHWNRRTNFAYGEIEVRVRSNLPKLQNALLSVYPPAGWRAEPEHEVLDIERRGEEHSYRFFLIQERGGEGVFPVRALVRWGGAVFDQGYTLVHGARNQVAFGYRPSTGSLVSAEVDVPENLEVGYVGVAGDPIPATLRDINVKVTDLGQDELMQGRLGKYWAIVLGPHALDTREDLAGARTRLLSYGEAGGALVILGQADAVRFSSNAPLPYPMDLGTARVSNEASAVEMIEEHDDLLWDPNEIGSEDFRGWSEERGGHFAERWDAHFQALLRMSDPGQPVQEGSLIRARYGRGTVVYTGLSFYRQLPGGVPGALRLLVNLLSSGAELHR
jgi:LmbE family N-acetylglucosaminyl deacetylase